MLDEDPMDGLTMALQRMWPDHLVVVSRRHRAKSAAQSVSRPRHRLNTRTAASDVQLAVMPSASRPRMLIPLDGKQAALAVSRYNAAIGAGELAERLAVGATLRLGAARLLPDRVTLVGDGESIVDYIESVVEQPVQVSVTVGNARANRKPVLGIFGLDGRLIAYAKIGDTPIAHSHVQGEAEALQQISGLELTHFRPPEFIHVGEWKSLLVLLMSALPATARQSRGRRGAGPPIAAMNELSGIIESTAGPLPLAETEFMADCSQIAAQLEQTRDADRLTSLVAAIREHHGDELVRSGAWHGDFTPWNMAFQGDRPILLWDWERFSSRGLFHLDLCHYVSQSDVRSKGFRAEVIVGALDGLELGSVSAKVLSAVSNSYLLALACRYVLASQNDGGDVISGNARVLLDALEWRLRCLSLK